MKSVGSCCTHQRELILVAIFIAYLCDASVIMAFGPKMILIKIYRHTIFPYQNNGWMPGPERASERKRLKKSLTTSGVYNVYANKHRKSGPTVKYEFNNSSKWIEWCNTHITDSYTLALVHWQWHFALAYSYSRIFTHSTRQKAANNKNNSQLYFTMYNVQPKKNIKIIKPFSMCSQHMQIIK